MKEESLLKVVQIEDKDYFTAPSRIAEFRRIHPHHTLTSDVSFNGDFVIVKSTIFSGNQPISDGICAKKFVNERDVATAETLSKARAIANFGIGLVDDVAGAEEMENAQLDGKLNNPGKELKELAESKLEKNK